MSGMANISVFCFLTLISVCITYADDDLDKYAMKYTSDNFLMELSKKPHFVMFFAPWCGHCKRLRPTWNELAKKYNQDPEKSDVIIAKVDCTEETALCSQHGVTGYPTLKFFNKNQDKGTPYKGVRDIESLEKFIRSQLSAKDGQQKETEDGKPEVPTAKGALVELTSDTFQDHIETGSHFVKFYAPWCGHCKRLAPTWDDLARTFEHDKTVSIAKIDCTQHRTICQQQNVRGYPTLLWFVDGKSEEYHGGRSHEDLKAYVSRKLGTEDLSKHATDEMVPGKRVASAGEEVALDSSTFVEGVAKGVTFVKFYAPWCGHCKRLAPTWVDLAKKFENNPRVTIAKVDCDSERQLCQEQKINGYPTLVLFRNGERVEVYQTGRDLESLYDYVNARLQHDEL